MEGIKVEG